MGVNYCDLCFSYVDPREDAAEHRTRCVGENLDKLERMELFDCVECKMCRERKMRKWTRDLQMEYID